jgi:hypothetical protein
MREGDQPSRVVFLFGFPDETSFKWPGTCLLLNKNRYVCGIYNDFNHRAEILHVHAV